MAIYKGVIAGIGDKISNINVITPQFDARVNKFIIGQNCILDGLTLSGNILSAGSCLAEGYRGELSNPITLDTTAYVYGVFKVNHDSNILDEFYIETSTSANTTQNDILHTAGIYYLLLYRNGVVQLPKNYPAKAVYADNTSHINDNGTLGNNVTCPTQSVNDNSTKVANTQYVHNQIEEEIGYKTATVDLSSSPNTAHYCLDFNHKSNYVIIEYNIQAVSGVPIVNSFTIPNAFAPKTTQYTLINVKGFVSGDNFLYLLILNTNGTATLNQITSAGVITVPNYGQLSAGYILN